MAGTSAWRAFDAQRHRRSDGCSRRGSRRYANATSPTLERKLQAAEALVARLLDGSRYIRHSEVVAAAEPLRESIAEIAPLSEVSDGPPALVGTLRAVAATPRLVERRGRAGERAFRQRGARAAFDACSTPSSRSR